MRQICVRRRIRIEQIEGFPWNKQFENSKKNLFVRVAFRGERTEEQFLIPSIPGLILNCVIFDIYKKAAKIEGIVAL